VIFGGVSMMLEDDGIGVRTVSLSQHDDSHQEQQLDFILKCAQAPTPPSALAMAMTTPAIAVGSGIYFLVFLFYLSILYNINTYNKYAPIN
jgi:hypothetical protein